MPIAILMPALSPTMTSGTLARWLIKEGTQVRSGEVMAEIETDKATMEIEAVDEGTLTKILVADNSADVAVNTPIAVLLEDDEDASSLDDFIRGLSQQPTATATETTADSPPVTETTPEADTPTISPTVQQPQEKADSQRVFASPLAKRLAAEQGIDLAQLSGSGPHGRIIRSDVDNFVPPAPVSSGSSAAAIPTDVAEDPPFQRVPLSSMRKVIAERLSYAKQTIPHFYLSAECTLDSLLDLRSQMNEDAEKADKISVNDLVIKACATALIRCPKANACFDGDAIKYFDHADIAVAVSIDDGLITPLVRRADLLTLSQIAKKTKDLAPRARDGKLLPHEYQGGSFTVSNLGMFGVDQFSAVINPPHACIVAVGRGRKMPVVDDSGNIGVATQMNITLSVDHRAVDGAIAATLLSELKNLIDNPIKMLI